VLSYPPTLHSAHSDPGALTVALSRDRAHPVVYVNVTPLQGSETLANWTRFRIAHLSEDDVSRTTLDESASGLRFRGGVGSCIVDHYVSKIGANPYVEVACLVRGRTGSSVIVAATASSLWARYSTLLHEVVDSFAVR
jgi:hypothetical protein